MWSIHSQEMSHDYAIFRETSLHDLFRHFVSHKQLSECFFDLYSPTFFVQEKVVPPSCILLTEHLSQIVPIETFSLDHPSAVDIEYLWCLRNQEEGATTFWNSRMIRQLSLSFLLHISKHAKRGTTLHFHHTRSLPTAFLTISVADNFAAKQTQSTLLELLFAPTTLASVVFFDKSLEIKRNFHEIERKIRGQ